MLPNVLQPREADHVPVLAEEVRACLAVEPGETVIDATFGAGGHAAILADLHPLSKDGRSMQRHLFSGASEQTPDKQGRVSIPPALSTHAKLGRDVVVAGVNDRLEIWDRAAWKRELAEVEGSAEDVAERLAAQGS